MMTAATSSLIPLSHSALFWPYVQFFLGYILILITPGPNMMVVGTLAACRGLRGVLLLVASIGLGAAILSFTMLVVVQFAAPKGQLNTMIGVANILLLSFTAWRILKLNKLSPTPQTKLSGVPRHDIIIGFLCGFLNPITAAYFLSQYLLHSDVIKLSAECTPLILGVLVLATLNLTVVALLLSKPAVQIWVRKHLRAITRLICCALAFFALRTALPLLLT